MAVSVELRTTCPKCASPVPVNALVAGVRCPSCQCHVSLDAQFWQAVNFKLGSRALIREHEAGPEALESGAIVTTSLVAPACVVCGAALALANLTPEDERSSVECPCGATAMLRRVPRHIIPGLRSFFTHTIAEDAQQVNPGGDAQMPVAAAPVMFPCPHCGGTLPVDGSERTVKCVYCAANAYLPDDLWRRMHPAKKIGRWYVWVEPTLYAKYQEEMHAGRRGCSFAWVSIFTLAPGLMMLIAGVADGNARLRTVGAVLVALGTSFLVPAVVGFRRWDQAK
jgi:predicted RNA-binding Zn-ribbon protein involved in translation (DUF1610 family)